MNYEQDIKLELLSEDNLEEARTIRRDDVSEELADGIDTVMELTRYGIEHRCKGHTYVIRCRGTCIGVILLGEAIKWETDPDEMKDTPFYRLMDFVIDWRYRNMGIGAYVLREVIRRIYREYGVRPIALGVHKDNHGAARFYLKNGFRKTDAMENNDYYYLRYPSGEFS